MSLKNIKTEELIRELSSRLNVKSAKFGKDESVKVVISGPRGIRERYIRETGPGIIVQATKVKL